MGKQVQHSNKHFLYGLPSLSLWQSVAQSSQISPEKQENKLHGNDMQNQQRMIESGSLPLPYSSADTAVGVRGSVGRGQGRKERSLLFQSTAALSSTGAPQHNLHTTELTHTRPAQHDQHILQLHQHSTCSPHAFCLLQLVLQHFSQGSESSVAQSLPLYSFLVTVIISFTHNHAVANLYHFCGK